MAPREHAFDPPGIGPARCYLKIGEGTMGTTLIRCDIDFSVNGKQGGFLLLPHSSNHSAYGVIEIPIFVIKNGAGPTALLMGGNHGDEYEGPVALAKLARSLDVGDIGGRIIILPAINYPAFHAGQRNSPLDGLNLNRSFPGDANGSPTQQIAHFVSSQIVPKCDLIVDLHSGGASLDYVKCTNVTRVSDPEIWRKTVAMAEAFGAPITILMDDRGDERTCLAMGRRAGIPTMTTELGSGATLSPDGLRLAYDGVLRVLAWASIYQGTTQSPASHARMHEIENDLSYVYAPASGLFEPSFRPGASVTKGTTAGFVHDIENLAAQPTEIAFRQGGLLCMTRSPAQVRKGDCVALVVRECSSL